MATATTAIYTLSLHDALPICARATFRSRGTWVQPLISVQAWDHASKSLTEIKRSEEHTSELQSHHDIVCRLLLEKKNPTTCNISPASFYTATELTVVRYHPAA